MVAVVAAAATLTLLACGTGSGTSSSSTGGDCVPVTSAQLEITVTLTSDGLGEKTLVDVTVTNGAQFVKEPGDYSSKPENGTFLVLDVTALCKEGTHHTIPFISRS